MLDRGAIITPQFEKNTITRVNSEFGNYTVPSKRQVWAEARPVSNGLYSVIEKQHDTHKGLCVSGKTVFLEGGVSATFNGKSKTTFTHDEAIEVLKNLEEKYESQGCAARQKQPFKKRIHTYDTATSSAIQPA